MIPYICVSNHSICVFLSDFLHSLPRTQCPHCQPSIHPGPFPSSAAWLPAGLPSPTQMSLPPVSSSSHPGKEVLIGQYEQKEPFPGSPRRRESEAGFEEPAKGGEALALKMLLQFGTWQSRGTARGGARRWGAREKAPAGTLHSFHLIRAPCDTREGAGCQGSSPHASPTAERWLRKGQQLCSHPEIPLRLYSVLLGSPPGACLAQCPMFAGQAEAGRQGPGSVVAIGPKGQQ